MDIIMCDVSITVKYNIIKYSIYECLSWKEKLNTVCNYNVEELNIHTHAIAIQQAGEASTEVQAQISGNVAGRHIKSLSRSIENTPSSMCGPWEPEKSPYHMPIFIAGGGYMHRSLFLFLGLVLSITLQKLQGHVQAIYIRQFLKIPPFLSPPPQKYQEQQFLFIIFLTFHIA